LIALSQLIKRRRIGTQIALLVVTSLVIAQAVTAATFVLFSPQANGFGHSPGTAIGRLITTGRLLLAAETPQAREAIIAAARRTLPELHFMSSPPPGQVARDERLTHRLQRDVGNEFTAFALRADGASPADARQIGILLPDGTAITTVLPGPPHGFPRSPGLISALVFFASAVTLLSLWAARALTRPLARFADAAERFTVGRSDAPLSEQGPLEIRRAAKALNEMRARIQAMVEDRTHMLAAVSHDLRTPITRLRLRAEEVAPERLQRQIVGDLDSMRDMVNSALSFLRDEAKAARYARTDLPSLIQTLCNGFCDLGHHVSYVGPAHLAATCDPEQLTRALANLIDNGVKFGTAVTVELTQSPGGTITIAVRDDGPGIAAAERERVMEPFYRGDAARGLDDTSSFGLGLSIARSVAQAHGGTLELCDGEPKGLVARLTIAATEP
jgi:signal transduction histidine kinase